jgi:acyl carrier protein
MNTLTEADIARKVRKIIADVLGLDTLPDPTASLIADLGADSLDTVELIMALEEHFNIAITDDQAERCTTVQDAITIVTTQFFNAKATP